MNVTNSREPVVLAIYPCQRGFGYAVFESMYRAVDWGMRVTTKTAVHAIAMENVNQVLDWFRPQVVIMQDCACSLLRCSEHVSKLIDSITDIAASEAIALRYYTRVNIRECFSRQYDAVSRYEIALAISKTLPEFLPKLPAPRKTWKSEGYTMPIFDAASLVFTYYYFEYLRPKHLVV